MRPQGRPARIHHGEVSLAVCVFVVLEVGTRRILHWNATEHRRPNGPSGNSARLFPAIKPQRFLIHDRDSIYSADVDAAIAAMGLTVRVSATVS